MTLHRTCPLEIFLNPFAKPGTVRAFAFDLELAVGGDAAEVDADSGMLVNLVQVDAYLARVQGYWQKRPAAASLQEVLQETRQLLVAETGRDGVPLQRLCFYEKRGWHFGWENGLFCGHREWRETSTGVYSVETVSVWSGVEAEASKLTDAEAGKLTEAEASRVLDAEASPFADADVSPSSMKARKTDGPLNAKALALEVLAQNPSLLRVRVQHATSREQWELRNSAP
jgi:hypothetical protein